MPLDPSDETWLQAHAAELRDAVLLIHPSSALVDGLLRRTPDPRRLAAVCLYERPHDLAAHGAASQPDGRADGAVVFRGDVTRLLRTLPLRWRTVLIDGPIDDLSGRVLNDLTESIAAGGTLGWRGADAVAEAGLDRLVATGQAVAGERVGAWRSVIIRHALPRPGPTPRPQDWDGLRSDLATHDLDSRRAEDISRVGEILRPYREAWLLEDAAAAGGAQWPYRAPARWKIAPSRLPDGRAWPRISVVTASLGEPRFVEQAILSVLQQGYPNVECIIVRSGASAAATEVIERYGDHLASVVHEEDEGLASAINSGMARAGGEIVTWLDGDDMLAPGALFAIALGFATSGADMVAGIAEAYRGDALVGEQATSCADGPMSLGDPPDDVLVFHRSAVAFTRDLWQAAGARVDGVPETAMYAELWRRFAGLRARLHVIGRPIVRCRSPTASNAGPTAGREAEADNRRRPDGGDTCASWSSMILARAAVPGSGWRAWHPPFAGPATTSTR